jgi:L-seryl-tRNA(Ser) seleniumtransferase
VDRSLYYRQIPSTDKVLEDKDIKTLLDFLPRKLVLEAIVTVADELREKIRSATDEDLQSLLVSPAAFVSTVKSRLQRTPGRSLRRVVNATGIILNTNLGRAPLSPEAMKAVLEVGSYYSTLEYDVEKGDRGSRYQHVEDLLRRLTGAEGAMAVNNNAAAVLLIMDTFAKDGEVIASHGELIEIGGSFRIPEVIRRSGAELVAVGTTNKTRLSDYELAITPRTRLLLRTHTSNYRIVGFTEALSPQELAQLGRKHNIPTVEDLGSGVLVDLTKYGLYHEPTVAQAIKAGIDMVTFSGDKLLGGPQAGVIVGGERYIKELKGNPLTRAIRVDKLTLAALEATLRMYLYCDEDELPEMIPVLRMMTRPSLKREARRLAGKIKSAAGEAMSVEVVEGQSQMGGGSLPGEDIPTYLVALNHASLTPDELGSALRRSDPPVITRVYQDRVLIDTRTLLSGDEKYIVEAVKRIARHSEDSH